MRRSGIQLDVLGLYRACLRAIRQKPKEAQPHFKSFVRREFNRQQHVGPRDFQAIEYLLRRGRKQLELYQNPHIVDIQGQK